MLLKKIGILIPLLIISQISFSQLKKNQEELKHKVGNFDGHCLKLATPHGFIEITPFTPEIIKVTYKGQPENIVNKFSTIAQPADVKTKIIDDDFTTTLKTSSIKVVFNKKDFSISFINNNNDTLSRALDYARDSDSSAIAFSSQSKEAFYGGGSKAINIDRRGTILENYNQAHWAYKFGETNLNIAIPFLLSSRLYGIYMDNVAKSSFDICKTNPSLLGYKVSSGPVSFFFIGGGSFDKILMNYTFLTGLQPLPPRWALGYISSRYSYKSEREVTELIDKTQAAGIPLDGVVFDLYWYKSASLMGNASWYKDSFPNPEKMLHDYLDKGIKSTTISETYITKKSENFKSAVEQHFLTPGTNPTIDPYIFKDFWGGPAGLLDVFKPEAQKFYWDIYKSRIKEGLSGWWFDLGEPESSSDNLRFAMGKENEVHNAYSLFWAKIAFDGYRKDFPQSRIFTLPRSGYAGMQRYSVFPWSGDIMRTFDGLKAQIPIIISMGLNGVGYMHSDAGGFTSGGDAHLKSDPELYSRWLEFAAFCPVMRTHADADNYAPEPIFWDDATRLRVTKFIQLRYQLLPYNYTLAYINTSTGRPLVMPVNYFDNSNRQLEDINDEYLWGENMLVAPVIVQGQTQKKVIFPKGEWIGFNDLKSYRDSADVYAPIDSLPLFVKAGSIIPMLSPIKNTQQYNGKEVTLKYYAGSNTVPVTSHWFYDNGASPNSLKNKEYDLVSFTATHARDKDYIIFKSENFNSKQVKFKLQVPGKILKSVKFSKPLKYTISDNEIEFTWKGESLQISFDN